MSIFTVRVVSGMVRRWVRVCTLGLSPGDKDGRRIEIESDLWEHDSTPSQLVIAPEKQRLKCLRVVCLGFRRTCRGAWSSV